MKIYREAIAPILFYGLKADPEMLHSWVMGWLSWLEGGQFSFPAIWIKSQFAAKCCFFDRRLQQNVWGVDFINPLGLAAGFDKDGLAAGVWGCFGFGFTELGTCTYHAQPGNPLPRLFRLPKDGAILNRMGFNNRGAEAMAGRLREFYSYIDNQDDPTSSRIPKIAVGINIGKSKVTPLESAAADYLASFQLLKELGDYFVVNVSSPNTPGLRSLQDYDQLAKIFQVLQQENQGLKPILVKIAPDLTWSAISEVISVVQDFGLAGIIATNTTISREGLKTDYIAPTGNSIAEEAGGISGLPLGERSTEVIRYIFQQTGGSVKIIGVGGIFSAEDAWAKITAGACLLQLYTGLVYQGPLVLREILQGLLVKMEQHGFSHISEAVGSQVN